MIKFLNISDIYIGVDVGSSRTKLVALNRNKEIIGWSIKKSGVNFTAAADSCLDEVLSFCEIDKLSIVKSISTGYGRTNVSYADDSRTEISCHAKGCFYYFPFAIDIVDIGGQDNKVIKVNEYGKRTSFRMNRKCSAGTGSFLEEMSPRLNISIEAMNSVAFSAKGMIRFGSFCTVFTATEVLENIRKGREIGEIVKGLFYSVLKRAIEMDSFSNEVVVTGGVISNNPYLVNMLNNFFSLSVLVPKYPQLTGALGAALYALESV